MIFVVSKFDNKVYTLADLGKKHVNEVSEAEFIVVECLGVGNDPSLLKYENGEIVFKTSVELQEEVDNDLDSIKDRKKSELKALAKAEFYNGMVECSNIEDYKNALRTKFIGLRNEVNAATTIKEVANIVW